MMEARPRSLSAAATLLLLLVGIAVIVRVDSSASPADVGPAVDVLPGETAAASGATTATDEAHRRAVEVPPRPDPAVGTAGLRVRVVFETGNPVAERGVIVVSPRPGRARRVHRTTTGTDGVALLVDLVPGSHRVQVQGAGSREVEVVAGTTAEETFTLLRVVAIEGRVVDAAGVPVEGATVLAMPGSNLDHDDAAPVGVSGAEGHFRLEGFALPVTAWISARAKGRGAAPWRFVLATREDEIDVALRDVELRLGPGRASVRGTCLDETSTPRAGVTVSIEPIGIAAENRGGIRTWSGHEYETVTPADGSFLFRDLAAAAWRVSATADGLWYDPREVVIRNDADNAVIELVATTAAVIEGQITEDGGRPVTGAFVRIPAVPWARVAVDENGSFALFDLPPRRLELRAFADGFDDLVEEVELRPGSNAVRLTLTRRPRFVGVARAPDGTRLVGWRVGGIPEGAARPAGEADTDAEGRFEFDVEERTPHRFCVTAAGTFFRTRLGDLGAFLPGPDPVDLVVPTDAVPTSTIVGRLPRSGVEVLHLLTIRNGERQIQASAFGDGAYDAVTGEFRLGPIPAGDYGLVVGTQRRVAGTWGRAVVGESAFGPFALAHGETRDVGLLQLPEPGRLQISFTVPAGCEPRNVKMEWHSVVAGTWGLVDLDPRAAQVQEVIPGAYDVTIWGEGFLSIEQNVAVRPSPAAATLLEVVLEAGQRLPLALVLPPGESRASFTVRHQSGRLAYGDEFGIDEATRVQRWPVLGIGGHRVEVLGGSGRRYLGEFVVDSLTPTTTPIEFDLRPLR